MNLKYPSMDYTENINMNDLLAKILKSEHIDETEIEFTCEKVTELFICEPNILNLDSPIALIGDIHGQFADLLSLFEFGLYPPESNYLFLGDYVDRGKQSIECISLLFAYKIKYPQNFFLLRGNHESKAINKIYGFYDECKRRYSIDLWKMFCDCFDYIPIAGLIEDRILCMHGGISPELRSLDQIRDISRPTEIPENGLVCDLCWSDPEKGIKGWGINERGVSVTFGVDKIREFLDNTNLDIVVRAHQVVEDGYEFFGDKDLVTVFSAPNYCGDFNNSGAIMSVDKNLCCSFQVLKPSNGSEFLSKSSHLSNYRK